MGTTPLITTNTPQNTRSTKPDQAIPIPVPRRLDPRYQYMKRHGMLDENGDPLPQFEVPEDAEDPTTNDQTEDTL